MKYRVGQKVKDKFKRPKPGDESVTGEVTGTTKGTVTVKWETGWPSEREYPLEQADHILEIVR